MNKELIQIKTRFIKYIISILIIYISIVSIYYSLYSNTIEIIKSEFDATSQLIEQSIFNETKYTEVVSQMVERDITNKMKEYSIDLVEKYKKDDDILNWDFSNIKQQIDGIDIFIINDKLEIVESTIDEEIGLSFIDYSDFSKTLIRRLNGDEFKTDKINFSIVEKELRKYSYIPTPDHKYLIELGVDIGSRYPEVENLNVLNLSKNLRNQYPFVEDIRVYEYNRDQENSRKLDTSQENSHIDKNIERRKAEDKYVKQALESNEVQEQIIKDKDNSYTFKYIPYIVNRENHELKWWGSYVIEVLYNDQLMMEKISHQRYLFLRSMIVISTLYFIFISAIFYLIQKNRKIAHQDHLTKLDNRKRFEEVLVCKMKECDRRRNKLAVLFFDLDKFKKINDSLGHNVGDKVLQEIARKIKTVIPKRDIVSRLGGDEFIALVSMLNSEEEVEDMAKKIASVFDSPLHIDSLEIPMRPSIGISIYPDDAYTAEELVANSDVAMYCSKENNKRYTIYSEQLNV